MIKTTTNHDIPPALWDNLYTSDELRQLAENFEIMLGRSKLHTAINLTRGKRHDGTVATFHVQIGTP